MESADGSFVFEHNTSSEFPAASIIKLFILDYALEKDGRLDDTAAVDDIRPGDDSMLKFFAGSELTIRSLLSMMIDVSDNTATNFLIDRYGMPSINAHISARGMPHTHLRRRMLDFESRKRGMDNVTSLQDVFRLIKLHTRRESGGAAGSQGTVFEELMRSQHDRSRLSLLLPEGITGTKSGSLDDVYSDVGFYAVGGRYSYAGFLTRGRAVEDARLFIPELSLLFFNRLAVLPG
ncbi:MAG: serine hydrolase [Thermoplasmata archaeon]|nr:serine hydrolase [Candidatus Sysuiplasma jiujiangense]